MRFELIKQTAFGGWIATVTPDGKVADPFARVYTNKPNTREVDPQLSYCVALMLAAPELIVALGDAVRLMPLGTEKRAVWFDEVTTILARLAKMREVPPCD